MSRNENSCKCLRILIPLLISATAASAIADDIWAPHEHPATVIRKITGFTEPARTLTVSSEFDGRIADVLYDAGETIPGEYNQAVPLARLDDTFARLAWRRATAATDTATQQQHETEARLDLAQRERAYRKREVDRIEALAADGKIAATERDAAEFASDTAVLQVKLVQTAVELAAAKAAEADVAVAEAEERLRRHTLSGPGGWHVVERVVEPGTNVQPGTPALRLADTRELAVILHLSETEVAALTAGPVVMSFPHYPSLSRPATIHRVAVEHDLRSNKREVELRIAGAPPITGGIEVSISLEIDASGDAVEIPSAFLGRRLEQYYITSETGESIGVIPLSIQNGAAWVAGTALPKGIRIIPQPDADE